MALSILALGIMSLGIMYLHTFLGICSSQKHFCTRAEAFSVSRAFTIFQYFSFSKGLLQKFLVLNFFYMQNISAKVFIICVLNF